MKEPKMKIHALILLMALGVSLAAFAAEPAGDLAATTSNGDAIVLHANGRWEFIDSKKAAAAQAIAKQYPENQGCPSSMQGGFLGFGRCVPKGDKDYNRGSLSGKGR
ncbi:MAG TPA: hypothetical protein VFS17_05015 [Methylophilaceae bacterium]|nr:hypothetical protein [Methylophilaceae bacterium]